ncbi:MAG: leucine-rich repeat protein, partial [Candidatus Ancillula sp.]|nr:leucine-rich repeat protein [Candidatus Ancillula sp.]
GSSTGTTNITGGTIIGLDNIGTSTTNVSGYPVILAKEVNGKTASAENRANGILIGDDVTITDGNPITVTINADMTIPSGATFQVPEGVKVVVPEDKTLTVVEGGTLDISGELDVEESGTVTIEDGSNYIIEDGGQVTGGGTVNKPDGSNVTDLTLASKTSTSITINPATLLSETGQEVEYAISTTNELPASEEDWQTSTTFTSLNPDTQYYIFARSKENTTHKAGAAKQLGVKTGVAVAYTNSDDSDDSHSSAKWWTFNSETGTLIINLENVYAATGSTSVEVVGSACAGYSSACRLSIQHVVFTNTGNHVTELTVGAEAFWYSNEESSQDNKLTSISFPDSLDTLRIDDLAFAQGSRYGTAISLSSIAFPEKLRVLEIGSYAFAEQNASSKDFQKHGALGLKTVTFPDTLETLNIGSYAFNQSTSSPSTALESVSFPKNIKTLDIGLAAFSQSSLNVVVTGAKNTSLKSVTFPEGLETLGVGLAAFSQSAEEDTALSEVSFPKSLKILNIGNSAFSQSTKSGRTSLETVTFPSNLEELNIGEKGFAQTKKEGGSGILVFKHAILPVDALYPTCNIATGAFATFSNSAVYPDPKIDDKDVYWLGEDRDKFGESDSKLKNIPLTSIDASVVNSNDEPARGANIGDTVHIRNVEANYSINLPDDTISITIHPSFALDNQGNYKVYDVSSSVPEDEVDPNTGDVTFRHASKHVISVSATNQGITKTFNTDIEVQEVVPTPNTPDTPASTGTNNASTIGTAITGVNANALVVVMLMMLLMLGTGAYACVRKLNHLK